MFNDTDRCSEEYMDWIHIRARDYEEAEHEKYDHGNDEERLRSTEE